MSGYIFHCTPCGKPHAGECPPAKKERIFEAYSSEHTPHTLVVGGHYRQESKRGGIWMRERSVWRILGVFVDFVDIESITTGVIFQSPKAAFSFEGVPLGSDPNERWRLVREP